MQEPIIKIILAPPDFLESSKDARRRALLSAHTYKAELIVLQY